MAHMPLDTVVCEFYFRSVVFVKALRFSAVKIFITLSLPYFLSLKIRAYKLQNCSPRINMYRLHK